MTPFELKQCKYFDQTEKYLGTSRLIDFSAFSASAMFALDQLRESLGSAVYILRGPHPNRPEAIDACCPGRSMEQVFMQLCRLQFVSWGVYSGNSFHLDARAFVGVPARWFAVHSSQSARVVSAGCPVVKSAQIPNGSNAWDYFAWDHPKAFEGLTICLEIARSARRVEGGMEYA